MSKSDDKTPKLTRVPKPWEHTDGPSAEERAAMFRSDRTTGQVGTFRNAQPGFEYYAIPLDMRPDAAEDMRHHLFDRGYNPDTDGVRYVTSSAARFEVWRIPSHEAAKNLAIRAKAAQAELAKYRARPTRKGY